VQQRRSPVDDPGVNDDQNDSPRFPQRMLLGHRTISIRPVLDPKVFKAYDLRGIYPDELDEDGAYAVGRAYVEEFEPRSIAVGRDMRLSSPGMAAAVMRGTSEAGAEVVDLGMVGTEMAYFAVGELDLEGGIMVTASHNPKEYTGMKIVRRGALPVGGDSGLLDIRTRALAGARQETGSKGTIREVDIWPRWVEAVLSFIEVDSVRPLRVVIDAANGMAGVMLPPVLERLPIHAVPYFFEPDGSFPNHEPNPLLPENREFIVEKVKEEGADLGVAFDGDADRCFFVDETGEFVPGDFVTALLAESIVAREPGAPILYDVRASWAVPETIERAGGIPLVNRVGHAFFKHRMREEGAVFGGEVSGHYYFRDFSQADSGVIPFLLMLELISKRQQKLSEILRPYNERYFITGELNTPVDDVALKLQELKERFGPEGTVSHLDGLSVDSKEWHMNVRPSNTEPLLRLNLEALSPDLMQRKRDEVLEVIRS
jgi:phosphomannomutase